jgi:hypothetical protein
MTTPTKGRLCLVVGMALPEIGKLVKTSREAKAN